MSANGKAVSQARDDRPIPVHHLLGQAARERPYARAITDHDGSWDYFTLHRYAAQVASWLGDNGVAKGDRVVLKLPSSRPAVAVLYGCLYRGVTAVPVNYRMKPFQYASVLRDADPALVIEADSEGGSPQHDRRAVRLSQFWAEVERAERGDVVGHADDDLALIIFTSGSTSTPTGVACPYGAVSFAAQAIATRLGYVSSDVVVSCLPLSFDYGLYQLFLSASAGAELVLVRDHDMVALFNEIHRHSATIVPVLPTVASLLVQMASRKPRHTRVRLMTNTGALLDPSLAAALRHHFPEARVVPMYGLTECKRVSIADPDEDLVRPYSVGRPLPGTSAFPVDEKGRPVPAGEIGQIVVRGRHIMSGYWREPGLTAQRFQRDQNTGEITLFTGDYGYCDADGRLYFSGRRDDIFKRNGYRVSTIEIEAAALDLPDVDAAVVIPPHEGRDLTIFATGSATPPEVIAELAARLELFKVPSRCYVIDEIPLTAHGKVDRRMLAAQLTELES